MILSCKVVEIIKIYIFERKSKVLSYCKLPLICKSEYEKLMVGLHDIATGISVQMFLTITTMTCFPYSLFPPPPPAAHKYHQDLCNNFIAKLSVQQEHVGISIAK